jgi:hypothetical protein
MPWQHGIHASLVAARYCASICTLLVDAWIHQRCCDCRHLWMQPQTRMCRVGACCKALGHAGHAGCRHWSSLAEAKRIRSRRDGDVCSKEWTCLSQVMGIPTISQPTHRGVNAACMPIEDALPLETLHQITFR